MGYKRMFFDVETSYCQGWFWGTSYDTKVFKHQILIPSKFICISWKWEGSKKVHNLEWDKGCDKKMIFKFLKEISKADTIVAHNGDRFDIPKFKTRCLLLGVDSIPEIKSIDTLKMSRSQFKFESNKLDDIAFDLGIGRKIKTDIQLWHDIIQANCPKAMKKMVRYCNQDVRLLEKVYKRLEGYVKPKIHKGVQEGKNKCSCPYCAGTHYHYHKRRVSAKGAVSIQIQCQKCGKYYAVTQSVWNNKDK